MASRLIGNEEHSISPGGPYGGRIIDSTGYTYTGNNGGDLTHTLKYTTKTYTSTDFNEGSTNYYDYADTQTFDENDNIDTFKSGNIHYIYYYDNSDRDTSTIYQYRDSNSIWVNDAKEIFGYDADSNVILDEGFNWNDTVNNWEPDSKTVDSFDSHNNLILSEYFLWSNTYGSWQPDDRSIASFDSHNNIIFNQTEYGSGNNWDTAGYTRSFYNYTIYGKATLETDIQYYSNSVVEDTADSIHMFYNSNNLLVLKIQSNNWTDYKRWFPSDSIYFKYDDNSNVIYYYLTSYQIQGYWLPTDLDIYQYNDFNQLTFSATSLIPALQYDTNYYYYQTYTTGINQLSVNNNQLTIYPNPTSDYIHASIQLNQPSSLQLRLVNMLGQTMWVTDAGTATNYQNNISVANLPDGVYLLEMVTEGGTVSKEVVVTHPAAAVSPFWR